MLIRFEYGSEPSSRLTTLGLLTLGRRINNDLSGELVQHSWVPSDDQLLFVNR